jgi:solute carrier family 25 citrate transporter 1
VTTGIIPKMAIRFTSYEWYKTMLASSPYFSTASSILGEPSTITSKGTFLAGLAAGVTEAVAVVTPMEVVKIRLQAQYHSMSDPLDVPKYRGAAHVVYLVFREEGIGALWRGVGLTGELCRDEDERSGQMKQLY